MNQLAPPKPEKIKVRDPDTFDSTAPKKLRDFLVSCNLHFQDCPNLFTDDEKKILFILSFLKGTAISWFEPALMDPNNAAYWMWDFDAFILELKSNFGPHDPISDAENLLTNLTMNENSGNSKTSNKPKVNALTEKLGKDRKLTAEEWERRIKEKLCLYCGNPRHKASECNKSAAAKGCAATVESKDSSESKK